MSRSELIQLELLMDQGIQYARDQLTGISVGEELFNPEKLQKLSEDYQFFDEISSFHKGKKQRNYYIFIKPKGTVADTTFTKGFVDDIQRAIDDSGLENKISNLKIKLTGSLIVRLEENKFIVHPEKWNLLFIIIFCHFVSFLSFYVSVAVNFKI